MARIQIGDEHANTLIEIDFLDNPTAEKIRASLPLCSTANVWGDEIYFDTGIDAPAEGGTVDVEVGDVAYWPQGKCICIFFGPTPISPGIKPVPASDVVVFGRTDADPDDLRAVRPGENIVMEQK